ncbi:hypothetical protein EYB26_008368 [Talaromyces marneffei]|uniref:uncharacterized protein n=1 Tax=Talaromyces marneffei TaxID=37727 RepID=UPI0012A98D6A|nr:uncharacterized protein EYB26_008368 [Talaromyces marneffei]QGA20662.1 hypothetical protein EYB26_008368 [Talaromyces marneffei]
MNQDGAPNPKTSSGCGGASPHEDSSITNHEQIHHTIDDDNKRAGESNTPNLLATCAKSDMGGGVGLDHEVFAIYSTAALPPLWMDILHTSTLPAENIIKRLRALAENISALLPIYTSWTDIPHSPSNHKTLEIHTLTGWSSPSSTTPSQTHPAHNLIHRKKPRFLLNAALHTKHCIIGQASKTETLLAILRRPWCVLEICVSNVHDDVQVLERIREFALVAQEVDGSGYVTAVFLLGVEIEARRRQRRRQQQHHHHHHHHQTSRRDLTKAYELCNMTVFIPSLRSFNSFWIRLICVCAIELGVGFSCLIYMLCDHQQQQQPLVDYDEQLDSGGKSSKALSRADNNEPFQFAGRRHSIHDLFSSFQRIVEEDGDEHGDIVQRMLDLYKQVLKRTEDYL